MQKKSIINIIYFAGRLITNKKYMVSVVPYYKDYGACPFNPTSPKY